MIISEVRNELENHIAPFWAGLKDDENGGFYGFAGIRSLCTLMRDAYRNPKDRKTVLRLKGLGCASCLPAVPSSIT